MTSRTPRSRGWCFTLNNYSEENELHLLNLPLDIISYGIWGKEMGELGTPHLQGFLRFKHCKSMQQVKTIMDSTTVHLERQRGTLSQAIEYCKKDNDFQEIGTPPKGQGKRSDLDGVKEMLDQGASELEIADSHFGSWVRYRKSFKAYKQLKVGGARLQAPEVKVIWGPTGTGKTKKVHEALGTLWTWPGGQWYDGFQGQDNALFDDYEGEIPFRQMLRLCDRYPFQVPVKGSFVWWTPKTIWFTSNKPVEDWYPLEDISPLLRRINTIEHLTEQAP